MSILDPTILEECQLCIHMDSVKNMFCDSYIVEFVMLRLLLFLSASSHMLVFACLDNLFANKMPMHRKYVRLRCDFHMFYDALCVFQLLSFMWASLKLSMPS